MQSVTAIGFLINRIPAKPVTHFLLEVMRGTESDSNKGFFLYTPTNEELEELNPDLLFDPSVWDMVSLNPPLAYEKASKKSQLTMDTSGMNELTPGSEYMKDGLVYIPVWN